MNAEVLERSSLPCVFPLAKKLVKNRCEISNTSEGGFSQALVDEYSDRGDHGGDFTKLSEPG